MPYIGAHLDASAAQARLARIQRRLGNLKPLHNAVGEYLLLQMRERFDTTEAGPDGHKWKPLSRRYLQRKQKIKPGGKILTLGGSLKGSLGYQLTGDGVRVGTVKGVAPKHARIHQDGGEIKQNARKQVSPIDERGLFLSKKSAAAKFEAQPGGKRKRRIATRIRVSDIAARTITMPARPYVGINDRDRDRIRRDTKKFILAEGG